MTFGSLFAGIGGFDLGFERAGMQCKWQVEIDEYCQRVLAKHWPDVRRWDDIRTFPPEPIADWRVDAVVGGFPCQDISYAGTGAGLAGERSGLFYEAMRVVRVLEPRVVVLENVAALLTRGLDSVLGTLASLGFDAEWHCIPAAAVGAPHIRDRVFVVAHANSRGFAKPVESRDVDGCGSDVPNSRRKFSGKARSGFCATGTCTEQNARFAKPSNHVPNAWCDGLQVRHGLFTCQKETESTTAPFIRWSTEPDVGRVVNGFPGRVDRIRGLGNAVVPQVAEWIGRRLMENANQ